MIFKDLEKALTELVMDLKPAPEKDNTKWIERALQYGELKEDDWKYGTENYYKQFTEK